jgi:hypothetical protein
LEIIMQTLERRSFLKLALGLAAVGVAAVSATQSQAMPTLAMPAQPPIDKEPQPEPAIANQDDVADAAPEKVQWHYRRYSRWHWRRRWHYRRWYWRRRWRHRYWY